MQLCMNNISKRFGDFAAVDDVTLTMTNGVYGLLGVNGAGKTTLMRMLCTLLKPTSGNITCDGQDIFAMDAAYRDLLGYLPQEFGFYPDFSVRDYLRYIATLKGVRPVVARDRVERLIRQVGLEKVATRKMKRLSGGMKRRAGIAQAMLNDPRILILDEPTAALDPIAESEIYTEYNEMAQDKTSLFISHRLASTAFCDRILYLENGRVLEEGTHAQLLAQGGKYRELFGIQSCWYTEGKETAK